MTPELSEYLAFAHRLADVSGDAIRPFFRTSLKATDKAPKGCDFSPVTLADEAAEEAMRRLIRETYPSHGIYGEEYGRENPDAEYSWVLDPIDGTKAFLVGFPLWGTLIALNRRGEVVLGLMNQPILGERFVGVPDGSFLGQRRLKTRPCADLSQATLCITGPEMLVTEAERAAFSTISERVTLTKFGGDCYSYCMLALGLVDLVIEGRLHPWDIQALIPIVEGAGGVLTSWNGGPPHEGGLVVACGDRRIHRQVVPILAEALERGTASC